MKLCMSHYGHENIPDAKLSPVALPVFEIYVTKFPLEKGASHQIQLFTPWKMGLAFKKIVFMSRIIFLDPKLTPPPNVNFSNFQVEEIFSFCKFWDFLMRKEQQQPPRLINFAKIWSEHVFKINMESHNIWASYVE